MTHAALQKLLADLPEKQREEAEKRIRFAELCGWTAIGLWCAGDADISDLVGNDAKGVFGFLPNATIEEEH